MARPHPLLAAIAGVSALTLSGCAAVGTDYARPQMSPPAQFRFAGEQTQAESAADASGWQVIGDPALQALIRDALVDNLDLRAALARVEQARAQAGIARSFLYPQVDGTASFNFQQNTGTSSDPEDDVQHGGFFGFQLSWELDLFGRIRREREAAEALMLA